MWSAGATDIRLRSAELKDAYRTDSANIYRFDGSVSGRVLGDNITTGEYGGDVQRVGAAAGNLSGYVRDIHTRRGEIIFESFGASRN